MECKQCGKQIDNDSKICNGCGATVDSAAQNEGKKKKVKFKDLPKKQKMTRIIIACACFLVAAVLIIVGIVAGGSKAAEEESFYINQVKTGKLDAFPDVTIETAFNAFFSNPKWKSFESEDGLNIVEFNGGCTLDGESINCCIQFNVSKDGTFETYYADLDGEQLTDNEDILSLYEAIFGQSSSGGEDEEAFDNAFLMLYNKSALPSGLSQAVAAGVYEDVSIGEMIDYMFPNPEITYERVDESIIAVKISGNYRHSIYDSATPYSGAITYNVGESGTITLRSDPDGIKGIMETLATQLASNY